MHDCVHSTGNCLTHFYKNSGNTTAMQGLQKNRTQFYLLVLVNAFVGAMIGLERAILPGLGQQVFKLDANTALLSFIMAFGLVKAVANYSVAILSKRFSRKQILLAGWIAAIPVPLLLMYAPNWGWVVAANILLGINQGLAWSATVIMKIDLVGTQNRGLAMGINEFAGYLAVGLAGYLASSIAARYGYAYYPFLPGLFFLLAGLLLTIIWVKDTGHFLVAESQQSPLTLYKNIGWQTTWLHPNMGTVTLNGLVNNMNDAVVWGLVPLLLASKGFSLVQIGVIAGVYPVLWGGLQLITGKLGDVFSKKYLIATGMWVQAIGIWLFGNYHSYPLMLVAAALLGFGTALVYPNFLTVVAENSHPQQRAQALSIFRFWRDGGYVIGALLAGLLADILGMQYAIEVMALLTALAGGLAQLRMKHA